MTRLALATLCDRVDPLRTALVQGDERWTFGELDRYSARLGLVRCWIGGREWLENPGSVGPPMDGVRIRVLAEDGSDLPAVSVGEIVAMPATGPGSTYRYIGAPRNATPDGWESVGDTGWLDEIGHLHLVDRKDDLIISGGVNIWPAEIEAAILQHPDVRGCAAWGIPDADLGAIPHVLVETEAPLTIDMLSQFLKSVLALPKHPRSLDLTTSPVRDDAGKIRKPRQKAQETS
ncbi:hypothetical protein [Novosphingobium sp. BL-52-GroH]|uniref:AMP-binding enzyme n=1 Tax=Novosphingobium sp. BL-52-GroH TaxID=3349877 RepID=UPI00384BB421